MYVCTRSTLCMLVSEYHELFRFSSMIVNNSFLWYLLFNFEASKPHQSSFYSLSLYFGFKTSTGGLHIYFVKVSSINTFTIETLSKASSFCLTYLCMYVSSHKERYTYMYEEDKNRTQDVLKI